MQEFDLKDYAVSLTLLETLLNSYPESKYIEQANVVLNYCSRLRDCDYLWRQIKALPPGGGMIFFPPLETNGTRTHQR